MNPLTQIIKKQREEFEKSLKEPDITNAGNNSPKVWIFEGYVAAKKEAKPLFISSHLSLLKTIVEMCEGRGAYKKPFSDSEIKSELLYEERNKKCSANHWYQKGRDDENSSLSQKINEAIKELK